MGTRDEGTIARYLAATQTGLRVTSWLLARLRLARAAVALAHAGLEVLEAHLAELEVERVMREAADDGAIYCAEEGHA